MIFNQLILKCFLDVVRLPWDWPQGYVEDSKHSSVTEFLVYMPLFKSPSGVTTATPEIAVKTGASVFFRNKKIPIKIVFGGALTHYGTLFGLGLKMTGKDKKQLVRMDYHGFRDYGTPQGHGGEAGVKKSELAVWEDQPFHCHVMKWKIR